MPPLLIVGVIALIVVPKITIVVWTVVLIEYMKILKTNKNSPVNRKNKGKSRRQWQCKVKGTLKNYQHGGGYGESLAFGCF
uniref:Protein Vpu n=1 Tax=Human immunodeficiency virus type 1 TaxID=11676 RepID=A0A0A0US68_HV1|nr:vpu protein [Human immunodeficiency virus 1]